MIEPAKRFVTRLALRYPIGRERIWELLRERGIEKWRGDVIDSDDFQDIAQQVETEYKSLPKDEQLVYVSRFVYGLYEDYGIPSEETWKIITECGVERKRGLTINKTLAQMLRRQVLRTYTPQAPKPKDVKKRYFPLPDETPNCNVCDYYQQCYSRNEFARKMRNLTIAQGRCPRLADYNGRVSPEFQDAYDRFRGRK